MLRTQYVMASGSPLTAARPRAFSALWAWASEDQGELSAAEHVWQGAGPFSHVLELGVPPHECPDSRLGHIRPFSVPQGTGF